MSYYNRLTFNLSSKNVNLVFDMYNECRRIELKVDYSPSNPTGIE